MSYQAEISRANPTCFIFLIDQSGSMTDGWAGDSNRKKADELATIINRLLQGLVIRNTTGDDVKDRFHIGVIGYGQAVNSSLAGPAGGQELVPLSTIAKNPARLEDRVKRVDDGAGGTINQTVRFPIWFDPVANGGTPMCQALSEASRIVQGWLSNHPGGFPPVVINITDGEATDGNPLAIAENIRQLSSSDGNVLLFNIHLSSRSAGEILYPSDDGGLADEYAKLLFQMSSVMPPKMFDEAKKGGYSVSETSRGFAFNANIVSVIDFLEIGTRPGNLR